MAIDFIFLHKVTDLYTISTSTIISTIIRTQVAIDYVLNIINTQFKYQSVATIITSSKLLPKLANY